MSKASADGHRHYDHALGAWIVQILPGEMYVTQEGNEVIGTVLGSCVSTCIRDPIARVAGMNHFMLPDKPTSGDLEDTLRYGSSAMERLINELLKRGASRRNLQTKVFGGGSVIGHSTDVGDMNVSFVNTFLQQEGLEILASDVGGRFARRIRFFCGTGKVKVNHLEVKVSPRVAKAELLLQQKLRAEALHGAAELF